MFYVGVIAATALVIAIGVLSGKKAKSGFSGGKTAGAGLVAGAIIGTLVGGSSTIGTAQLAYSYGFSAWWYTLGGAIGVLLLGFVFLKPIYNTPEISTLADIITLEYGGKCGILVAILSSVGTFLSFIAQILSGCALLMAVFSLSFKISILIVSTLIILYVFFGGILALGRAGLAKTFLLGASVLICGIISVVVSGGFSFFTDPDRFPKDIYFNLFARGVLVDGGAALSLLVGVVTTQSYISAFISAKTIGKARVGAIISSITIPIMGACSVFVGMYMKSNYPGIDTKLALPRFILDKLPPFISGIMIAALLITVIGTASGLAMGISSMLYKNIYKPFISNRLKKQSSVSSCEPVNTKKDESITVTRICLLAITGIGALYCFADLGDLIISWSFLSMGLRGAVAFFPVIFALFFKKRIKSVFIMISMVGAAMAPIAAKVLFSSIPLDPLFYGLGFSLVVIIIGLISGNRKHTKNN